MRASFALRFPQRVWSEITVLLGLFCWLQLALVNRFVLRNIRCDQLSTRSIIFLLLGHFPLQRLGVRVL